MLTPPIAGGVLVAVSAGADSTALAVLLAEARVGPLVLAHVQHGLRPAAASIELAYVEALAARLRLPLEVVALTPPPSHNEAWARSARYAALLDLAQRRSLPLIATGHHAADRRETQLLHLLRGGGLAALRGIAPLRPIADRWLWRPLLGHDPAELREELGLRGIGWCEDASNSDLHFARNRTRHRLLPALVAARDPLALRLDRFAGHATRVLARLAAAAQRTISQALPAAGRDQWLLRHDEVVPHASVGLAPFLIAAAARVGVAQPLRLRAAELRALSRWLSRPEARGSWHLGGLLLERDRRWIGIAPATPETVPRFTFRMDREATDQPGRPKPGDTAIRARFDAKHVLVIRSLAAGDHLKQVASALPWFERRAWPALFCDGVLAWLPQLTFPAPPPPAVATITVTVRDLPALAERETGRSVETERPADRSES